ncbi:MAG: DUF1275 family protein [Fusobacteria bacterium]|nr:DUF1275 family protein [Fusobacteriota bacterium]
MSKPISLLEYKEPHLSNILLIIASGFIECIAYMLCFQIFASFMTGTIIIGVVEFATKSSMSNITLLRVASIGFAFIGGIVSLFYIRYKIYKKSDNNYIFTQMLIFQSILLIIFTAFVFFMMYFNMSHNIIAILVVLVLSFNMGFHHHHLGIKYKGMIYRTHFMTFNTWNMFNLIVKYRVLPLDKRKSSEGIELKKKSRFFLLVLVIFFSAVLVCAEFIPYLSFYILIVPALLFVFAAYFSKGKEV